MEQYEDSMIRREQSREAHPAWPNSPMGVPAGRSNLGLVSRRITTSPVFDASRQKNQIITSDSLFCWYSLGDRYSIGYSATWIGKAECLTLPGPSYHELRSSHDMYKALYRITQKCLLCILLQCQCVCVCVCVHYY